MMNRLKLGDIVWQRVNSSNRGMITGKCERFNGVSYAVTWSNLEESWHFTEELTTDKTEAEFT